ncbi:unnamed protein product [Miscanthus lutarioriparius]|uniref:Uncharacterized protein n=1 Tax=Miscanthus lutarioriparius TaxID=422564 RepID=A0A811Q5K8_9POAL|nr:unnamed protein product [Miscanthus lutarioriparius]
MPTERTCHLPTSPPLPSRRGPCRALPKVGEGERHRAAAGRGRGVAAVPAGQAARRQGHRWWWDPAAAAIGGGEARSRARPAPTSRLLSLDVEAARRSRMEESHRLPRVTPLVGDGGGGAPCASGRSRCAVAAVGVRVREGRGVTGRRRLRGRGPPHAERGWRCFLKYVDVATSCRHKNRTAQGMYILYRIYSFVDPLTECGTLMYLV